MNTLTSNWLTEDHIDFEYKKYLVLGYLQDVKNRYERKELYPSLSEVIEHYKSLKRIKDNADLIKHNFGKDLAGIDLEKMQLTYEPKKIEKDVLEELELIIDFSMPLFAEKINVGKEMYDYVEKNLSLSRVGISPLRKAEGYLIINIVHQKEAHVYQYGFSALQDTEQRVNQLQTEYTGTYTCNITNTFERIKEDLISTRKDLPNPAVYAIKSAIYTPFTETLLPIAKRFFMQKYAVV